MIKAALFDLDGVVLDTETQYTTFWGNQFRRYYPDSPGLEHQIKGMTLNQIFDAYYANRPDVQETITHELNEYEQQMSYGYIQGFESFVKQLRRHNIKTAVVTSSNLAKMENVYRRQPGMKLYFNRILTSEDFSKSKPHPDSYLKGAAALGVRPEECLGFEDSINGLKAARAAGLFSVGLATTNSRETVAELCDKVVDDFTQIRLADLLV
ncbi:HAD family phosphatase [Hallella bergensis]|uniref:HAD family hydrolase n=1 Tax=Hallella bergensis TaxID=242750 RepID=UPI0023F557D1|nr:HAD family phosphatase [Hallella bergensis]